MFGQVLNQIRVNHPDSVDTHDLLMAAVTGMLRAADPHSYVTPAARLTPAKAAALRAGRLYPVPISFAYVGGSPVVVNVAPGTHASRLDILPGDALLSVDGQHIAAESADELELVLAGERKTAARLEFERRRSDGSWTRLSRSVPRERFDEATAVVVATMMTASTGYVRVTTFQGELVADKVHRALQQLEKAGMTELLLDVRGNGGGSLREASRIASEFLPAGSVVYTAVGRREETNHVERVSRAVLKSERRYPIIVLIDAGSASATELVAGALQDHDRALIVGRPSFGKALLMQAIPLSDGSVVSLVIGHVKTPCGRVVQRQYRRISTSEYYRLARTARDTAGRPSCETDSGRRVYGGGGIYPDIVFDEPVDSPRWLDRVREQQLPLTWAAGWVNDHGTALPSLDSLATLARLEPAAYDSFLTLARQDGIDIPTDAGAREVLDRELVRMLAWVKWNTEGAYYLQARTDPDVQRALGYFNQAAKLQGIRR